MSPAGGAGLLDIIVGTPTRRGHPFVPTKGCKNGLGLRPKDPTHRNARPESQSDGFPERGLNGAYKVSQMHLPPPNLPRFGGGERPPILYKPPPPLTITMGLRLTVFASPNTPRASLSVSNRQPIRAPFPPRERGWGERADTPVATLGAYLCAVRI